MRADLLVVGGGPAGATAACRLAEAGRLVLLLEREPGPRHKVCGEFLSIEAQGYLAALGIDPLALGAAPISRLRLVHEDEAVETELPFHALGLTRRTLDEALLAAAARRGVEVARGVAVRSIGADGDGLVAQTDGLGALRTPTLFLGTGKHDVRGAKRRADGADDGLIGFKAYFALAADQTDALRDHIEVILFEGGYAGLQLVEGGTANLCLLVERERYEALGKSWDALLADLLASSPHLAGRLGAARALLDKPLAIARVPYGFVHRPADDDPPGLFRLGDQAGVIPSFSGDGMSIAMHTGRLAADAYLAGDETGRTFHRRVRADIAGQIRFAAVLHRAGRSAPGRRALLRACRLWPGAMRLFASWTRLPASALASAGHGRVSPAPPP